MRHRQKLDDINTQRLDFNNFLDSAVFQPLKKLLDIPTIGISVDLVYEYGLSDNVYSDMSCRNGRFLMLRNTLRFSDYRNPRAGQIVVTF